MSATVGERERLLTHVEHSRGHFSLTLARYGDGEEGQARALWEQLVAELLGRGCVVALVDFSGAPADVDVMRRLAAATVDAGAVFVVGLEQLLIGEDDRPRPTRALAKLNFDRDLLLARVPAPVVLWLSRRGTQALAQLAPDTFDVLRTTFELDGEPDDALEPPADTASPERWRPRWLRCAPTDEHAQFEARCAALRSLHADAASTPERAGDLASSLAEACFALGRDAEGDDWLDEAAKQHEDAGNFGAAVTARRRRAELRLFWDQGDAAQVEIDQAWALVERMLGSDDPLEVARARPDVVAVRNFVESARGRARQASDLELLERWRAGDRRAGSELLTRYFLPLRVYFLARDPEASVEDLIQQVFLRMAQHRFEGRSSFKTYLFILAQSVWREHLRERWRRVGVVSSDGDEFWVDGSDLDELLADGQAHAMLIDALRSLPHDAQHLLELYYVQGLTFVEIAELLEMHQASVKSRLHLARAQLRAVYAERTGTLAELDVDTKLPDLGRRLRHVIPD